MIVAEKREYNWTKIRLKKKVKVITGGYIRFNTMGSPVDLFKRDHIRGTLYD